MATVAELIYDVREGIRAFSDDSEIDNRYILYLYNIKRAKYLRQELNNYQRSRDNSILQTLCIGLEEISADECNIDIECPRILRTVKAVPTPLELHTKVAITKVKPTSRIGIPFNFITKDKIAYLEGAIFNKGIYAFLDVDDYIYVISPEGNEYKLLDCLTVTGIFENPLELREFNNCCNCEDSNDSSCFDELKSDYPLQPHFIDLIRMEIIRELSTIDQYPEDMKNNSTDK